MQPTLLAADADEYSVTKSLEAYLLCLFGYIMFNNTHGNSVDRILLLYAREIADGDEDVPPYSWGEAVLAATYRGLCDGCMKTLGNAILESQETVWAAPGVSGAHRVGACQSPGPRDTSWYLRCCSMT